MKDIFSDLYDKVLSFFSSTQIDETKSVAKNRLRTVLMQDRVGFSERAMQMMKDDMIESISKYLEIDVDSFDLSIDANETATILNLSIPVLRARTDEEIDEALHIQEKAKIEKTQEIVGEIKELVTQKAQELADTITKDDENNDTPVKTSKNKKTKKNNKQQENNKEEIEICGQEDGIQDNSAMKPLEKIPDTDDEVLNKILNEE